MINKRNLIISLIAILVIILSIPGALIYKNITNNSIEIISKNTVTPGEEFTVSLKVKGNETGALGIQSKVEFNKDVLELVDKKITKDGWMLSAYNENTGILLLEVTDESFFDKDAFIYEKEEIVEFTFKVKETVSEEKTNIDVSDLILVNSNYETIKLEDTDNKEIKINN